MLGNIRHWGFAAIILWCAAPICSAQSSWADALVDTKKLEFGVIAAGAEAVKVVTIQNTTQSTVHISRISTGCRCAEAGQPEKNLLQPG
jgi:hypothetical protein